MCHHLGSGGQQAQGSGQGTKGQGKIGAERQKQGEKQKERERKRERTKGIKSPDLRDQKTNQLDLCPLCEATVLLACIYLKSGRSAPSKEPVLFLE